MAADLPHETPAAPGATRSLEPADGSAPARGDRLLAALFWAWAAVLLLATLAQLFGWDGVLDVLDIKRLFSR